MLDEAIEVHYDRDQLRAYEHKDPSQRRDLDVGSAVVFRVPDVVGLFVGRLVWVDWPARSVYASVFGARTPGFGAHEAGEVVRVDVRFIARASFRGDGEHHAHASARFERAMGRNVGGLEGKTVHELLAVGSAVHASRRPVRVSELNDE